MTSLRAGSGDVCYACGEQALSPRLEFGRGLYARALGEFAQLYSCAACCHKQFVPEFPADKLVDVYAHYYTTEDERAEYGRNYQSPEPVYVAFAERIAALARDYGLGPGARMHEFGCGAGITVNLLRQMGFEATGSDWSAGAVAFARENGNTHVRQEDMTTLLHWRDPLDMALNLHAIEHVPRPIEALSGFRATLKPHGLIYLNTNQGASIVNKRHGMHFDSWYYYPQHLHYFSPQSFDKIARRAKLKPLLIGTTERTFDQILVLQRTAAEITARMENQEMEMLCARDDSAHAPQRFELPAVEPAEPSAPYDHDSHRDYFSQSSPWSYWCCEPDTLQPLERMLYSDEHDYYYYAPAFVSDHWMMHAHEGGAPMLVFTAPRDGVCKIEVRAALRFLNQPAMDVCVDAPGWERQTIMCDTTAPKTISVQALLKAGDQVRMAARSRTFPNPHRLVFLAGIRWLGLQERATVKAKRLLGLNLR